MSPSMPAENTNGASRGRPFVVDFSKFPPSALIDLQTVAMTLGGSTKTVRRLVKCGQFPPPARIGGKSVWRVSGIDQFFTNAMTKAARDAELEASRLRAYMPK